MRGARRVAPGVAFSRLNHTEAVPTRAASGYERGSWGCAGRSSMTCSWVTEGSVVAARPGRRERDRCGICRRGPSGADQGDGRRRWRALDLGTSLAYVEAEAPRVTCQRHGVVVCAVPWSVMTAVHPRASGPGRVGGSQTRQRPRAPRPARAASRRRPPQGHSARSPPVQRLAAAALASRSDRRTEARQRVTADAIRRAEPPQPLASTTGGLHEPSRLHPRLRQHFRLPGPRIRRRESSQCRNALRTLGGLAGLVPSGSRSARRL